jgi:hypothetical protein
LFIANNSRRKSPKRGTPLQIFDELVSFPQLQLRPGFSLELLLIQEEEVRRFDGSRGWLRKMDAITVLGKRGNAILYA